MALAIARVIFVLTVYPWTIWLKRPALKYVLAGRNLVGQIHHEETLHRMQDINAASRVHPRTSRCFQSTPEIDAV
ncbi:hypothetical protein [Paraburkholderia fungorum]|uniref:Secreted protein n=1 Tax=Paraburkholderia fungorum TaxID=134537 RepID=A0AAW3V4L0_9BURK|nr:hypothetical protein [Paraburkholderia fungorum]MBB4516049.1 hypothetical protein [Paraburkholderia fungorum]MBB6204846.1 hypothetical protein [Paraburkholderia fungorum]